MPRHSRSQNKSQNKSQNQSQNGGQTAAEYVEQVVGGPSVQHAGKGNVIAMNPISGGSGLTALAPAVVTSKGNLMSGGESVSVAPLAGYGDMSKDESAASVGGKKRKGKKGGNLLNQIALPAVLLYANNTFGRRRSAVRKTRRFRGSRKSRK